MSEPTTLEEWKGACLDARLQLKALQDEYAEFKSSSTELEAAMEDELARAKEAESQLEARNRETDAMLTASEKLVLELKRCVEQHKRELETVKERSAQQGKEKDVEVSKLMEELHELREYQARTRAALRTLEQENDDLQRRERAIEATLQDLAQREERAVENGAWLQGELEEARRVHQEQCTRLREDLRDLQLELGVKAQQLDAIKRSQGQDTPRKPDVNTPKHVQLTHAQAAAGSPVASPGKTSLTIVNDMLTRVKGLEHRLAVCVSVCRDILPANTTVQKS